MVMLITAEISTREKLHQQGIYKANKQIIFRLLDASLSSRRTSYQQSQGGQT